MSRRLVSFLAYARLFFADGGVFFRLIRDQISLANVFARQFCRRCFSPAHARERNISGIWALITDFI